MTDAQSPLAHQIQELGGNSAYTRLTVSGAGNVEAREILAAATAQQMFSEPIVGAEDAQAAMAGLWLWQDWLEESHRISQGISSETGSFWHAIMHRREGDFSNSKYWYARCRTHPVIAAMNGPAGDLVNPQPPHKILLRMVAGGWKPEVFVDLVEEVHGKESHPLHGLAVGLQKLEWRLLMGHCVRGATGK